jgi:hypothetical protein
MTYETKMARVRALIEAFNASAATKIEIEAFELKLKGLGVYSEGTLDLVRPEDLEDAGLPTILARQVCLELKGKKDDDYVSQKKVDRMNYQELLERYDPREDNLVARKLKELSGGKRFIVFLAGDKVDVEASVRLLTELKRGLGEAQITNNSKGVPVKPYKVGEVPNDEVDENPLYPGRVLRTDETCDQTLRSWKGVPLELRQLLYIAVSETKEAKVASIGEAHDLLDRVLAAVAEWNQPPAGAVTAMSPMGRLGQRYPRAVIRFEELKEKGQLPRLKIKSSRAAPAAGHPFFQPEE